MENLITTRTTFVALGDPFPGLKRLYINIDSAVLDDEFVARLNG